MEIYKQNNKIIFEFEASEPRIDMYTDEEYGRFPTFTGIIEPRKWCEDPRIGFAMTIDMSYKGKGDQWTDIVVEWFGSKEDFIKKCEELDIDVVEYERCARCKGAIMGCSTMSKELTEKYGGAVCSITCED